MLPRYDLQADRDQPAEGPRLPFCVSGGAWFQVVEAFRPKTADFEQTLADVVSSPYIHSRQGVTKEVAQAVVARVALYKNGTPELAARVFMNSAAMAEIERRQQSEEQLEAIDNAIVEAAKAAQEEAREARQAAAQERERAAALVDEAERRVREAEAKRIADLERAEAAAEEAVRNEAARAQQAARAEAARVEEAKRSEDARKRQELDAARTEYEQKLQRQADELESERSAAATFRRRVRLGLLAFALMVVFVLLGLAVGLDRAWAYVVAVGVILGLLAGADQLLARRSG